MRNNKLSSKTIITQHPINKIDKKIKFLLWFLIKIVFSDFLSFFCYPFPNTKWETASYKTNTGNRMGCCCYCRREKGKWRGVNKKKKKKLFFYDDIVSSLKWRNIGYVLCIVVVRRWDSSKKKMEKKEKILQYGK